MVHLNEPAVKILFSNAVAVGVISRSHIMAPAVVDESHQFYNQTHIANLLQLWIQCSSDLPTQPAVLEFLSSRYFFWVFARVYLPSRKLYPQLEPLFVQLLNFGFSVGGEDHRTLWAQYLASSELFAPRMTSSLIAPLLHTLELALTGEAQLTAFTAAKLSGAAEEEPLRGYENLLDLVRNLYREMNSLLPSRAGPSPREKALVQLTKQLIALLARVTKFSIEKGQMKPALAKEAVVTVIPTLRFLNAPQYQTVQKETSVAASLAASAENNSAASAEPHSSSHSAGAVSLLESLLAANVLTSESVELIWMHWVVPNFYTAPELDPIRSDRSRLLVRMLRAAIDSFASGKSIRTLTKAAWAEVAVRALEYIEGVAEGAAVVQLLAASCGDRDLAEQLRMAPRLPIGVLHGVRYFVLGGFESNQPLLALMGKVNPESASPMSAFESQLDPLIVFLLAQMAAAKTAETANRAADSLLLLCRWVKSGAVVSLLKAKHSDEIAKLVSKWTSSSSSTAPSAPSLSSSAGAESSLTKNLNLLLELLNKK